MTDMIQCFECHQNAVYFDENTGDILCHNCGLIYFEKQVDYANSLPELHKDISGDQDQGVPASQDVGPLNPIVGFTTFHIKDAKCNNASVQRLRKAQKYNGMQWEQKSLLERIKSIKNLAHMLGIPKTIQVEILILCRKLAGAKYLEGRKADLVLTACVMVILSCHSARWTRQEILAEAEINDEGEFNTCLSHLNAELDMHPEYLGELHRNQEVHSQIAMAINLYRRHSDEMNIPLKEQVTMGKFIENHAARVQGCNPCSIAAAAFMVSTRRFNIEKTQKSVAELFGIDAATLRAVISRLFRKNAPN